MKITYTQDEVKESLLQNINDDDVLKKVMKVNLNVVGKIRAIMDSLARVVVDFIFTLMLSIYNNIFIYSADQEALISHLADRGLESWKQAHKSSGTVRIGSQSQPTTTIPIPALAIVSTEGDNSDNIKQFILLTAGSINASTPADSKGFYTVEISIESISEGADYNVPADSITEFITDIPGIDVVYNPAQTAYGRDEETISEVRERCVTRDNAIYRGMLSWFVSETQNFSFVTEAIAVPRYDGRGTIGIAFLTPSGIPTSEQIAEVQAHFNNDDMDPAGAYTVIVFTMSTKIWDAAITVYYSGDEPTDDDLDDAVALYFEQLERGEDIISDQIDTTIIENVGGIKSVDITSHSGFAVGEYEYPVKGTITWTKVAYAE